MRWIQYVNKQLSAYLVLWVLLERKYNLQLNQCRSMLWMRLQEMWMMLQYDEVKRIIRVTSRASYQ